MRMLGSTLGLSAQGFGNTIHHAGIKSVGLLLNVLHAPNIHKANSINLHNVQKNKIFSVINCKPDRLVNSNIEVVSTSYGNNGLYNTRVFS
jgi:hypothetical protein